MGQCFINQRGGGVDTEGLTAAANDVLSGKTFLGSESDEPQTGTLALSGSAQAGNVLAGSTFYSNDPKTKLTGTMPNNGAVSSALNAGGSFRIPEGYHNGLGIITANSLVDQTNATATADKIAEGYTAWVNGNKIIGTMGAPTPKPSNFTFFQTITTSTTWKPPVTAWYSIYCVGKSGNGSSGSSDSRQGKGGGGGGSGGISRSIVWLKTTDSIPITINDSITTFGSLLSATAGGNGSVIYAGAGGTATGGTELNLSGYYGGNGGDANYNGGYKGGYARPGETGGNGGALGGAGLGSSRYRGGGGGGGARLPDCPYTIGSLSGYRGGNGQNYDDDGNRTPAENGSSYPSSIGNPPVLYGGGNGGGGGGSVSSSSSYFPAGQGSVGTPGMIIIERAL